LRLAGNFAQQSLAVRRLPDLQPIAGVVRLDAQVLHDEVAIALEARAGRNRHLRRDLERLVNRQLRGLARLDEPARLRGGRSAPFPPRPRHRLHRHRRRSGSVSVSIPLGLNFGFAFCPLSTAISSRNC
jgi:hypothetical protein